MIDWWQALVLALLQGVTEFLPISSSAHLILPTLLLGWPDQGLAFDVAVHLGTLSAVVWYFRRDLFDLAVGSLHGLRERRFNASLREVAFLALATVPAVATGLVLSDAMDALRTLPVITSTTIVFALLLWLADRRVKRAASDAVNGWGIALAVGLAQALALVPGTSRSGVTLTAGLLLGLSRAAAARFSFLMSIPVIAGAGLLQAMELAASPGAVALPLLAGATLVAALSAYGCVALFLALIERIGMLPFVIYRLGLGAVLLLLLVR